MSHGTPPGQRCRPTKAGRNKRKCDQYAATNRRAKNKARKAATMRARLAKAAQARIQRQRVAEGRA